ncbi:hypothetical protein [Barnesiella sp. An22]|uniref:hypothetical protein n=1 Tax=Barnesiella sp. An22 TaxID=1965590 RepID=UPI003209FC27
MMNDDLKKIGKGGIVEEGVFVRFPELVPAWGNHFWREGRAHKKMLLIGESNYFDDADIPYSDFLQPQEWYRNPDAKLIPEYRKTDVGNWKTYKTFTRVYDCMNRILDENHIEHEEDALCESAFYNYFLRPAHDIGRRKQFVPQPVDLDVAGEALTGIIRVLEPELIVFLSKLAYNSFLNYCKEKAIVWEGIAIELVNHPASWRFHNAEKSACCGKIKFEALLREYWIESPGE